MSTLQTQTLDQEMKSMNPNNNDLSKAEYLIESHEVKGTPFCIKGTHDTGYIITLGRYKMCDTQKSVRACQLLIDKRDYQLLFAMISVACETLMNEAANQITQTQKQHPNGN